MDRPTPNPVVHLELHTGNLGRACDFYRALCGWEARAVQTGAGTYLALEMGDEIGGGAVECATKRPLWLPYVEVSDIAAVTANARALGAQVALEPREGPAGWRSVIATREGAELGLWQPKR